jgi:catechol 2,3-dioxygenase-like lactoylglutathione lyase family enzyme
MEIRVSPAYAAGMICGGHTVLYCSDVPTSVRFYIETLGMKLVQDLGKDLMILDAGDGYRIALHKASESSPKSGGPSGVGFCVRGHFEETVGIYENRGVKFRRIVTPHAKLAYFQDRDGNELHLWKLASVAD